ncbi:glycosyltransferase family 2 protein [Methylobacterium durans]|nr:glycosyltransferase family A protein [Methylobacterium durans]
MKMFVGIASTGRSTIIEAALQRIAGQTRPADRVLVCTPDNEEYAVDEAAFGLPITHMKYRKGSCSQRNAILDTLASESGILLIIDDDFLLHPSYLARLEELATRHADVALFNGTILKDGIIGPGLSVGEADAILSGHRMDTGAPPRIADRASAYGCNMAIRLEHSRSVRFDENLPLYGWQEDVDFSCRLSRFGRIVETSAVSGVHLGVKHGRTSGVRFGYSQVINPIYLARKRTMRLGHVLNIVARNVLMNTLRSTRPEPYIDRRGRLKGNILAARDFIRGRIDPLRVLQIE